MRICLLGNSQSIHIVRWKRALQAHGHETYVISLRHDMDPSITDFYLPGNCKAFYALNGAPIRRYIRDIKPDILHAHYALGYGLLGALSEFHPFILSVWGSEVRSNSWKRWIFRYSLQHADHILVTCEHMRNATIKALSGCDVKTRVISWGFDSVLFDNPIFSERVYQVMNKQNGDAIVFSARWLTPTYAHENLIRALPLALKRCRKLKVLFHSATREHYRYQRQLQQLAEQLGVSDSILFGSSYYSEGELAALYSISSVVYSAPPADALGNTVLEAMFAGLPVVGNVRIPSYHQVIKDGLNGFLVNPEDPQQVAEALLASLDFDKSKILKTNQPLLVPFRWEDGLIKTMEFYQMVAGAPSPL